LEKNRKEDVAVLTLFKRLDDEALKVYAKRTPKDYNWFRWHFYRFWRGLVWLYMKVFRQAKTSGQEYLPTDRSNFIVAANHVSNLDPFMIGSAIDPFNIAYMAKRELFEDPRVRWFMDGTGGVMVDRTKVEIATIRSAKAVIETPRWLLGIFPEGTRNRDGKAQPKKGAAFIAKVTGADVLPVAIWYNDKGHVSTRIGPMILNTGQDVDVLTQTIDDAINALKPS